MANSQEITGPVLCRMLSWPSERKQHGFKESVLYDVYDGEQWATAVLGDDHIAPGGELGHNLVFGVCGNGVDPMEHKNHSLWPLPITCFNLPARLRYTLPALGLVCITLPNSKGGEPTGFQPFMDIFLTKCAISTNTVWRFLMALIGELSYQLDYLCIITVSLCTHKSCLGLAP